MGGFGAVPAAGRGRRAAVAVGVALLLLYALPLFAPPAAAPPMPPPLDGGLWARIFPTVPPWWAVGRLLCLFAGALTVGLNLHAGLPLDIDGSVVGALQVSRRSRARRWARGAALAVAFAQTGLGVFAAQFTRFEETLYFLCLAVPAGLLAWSERGAMRRRLVPRLGWLLVVPVLWLGLAAPTAWRSPRAANVIDMWIFVERLEHVVLGHQQVLAGSAQPGHGNAYMMLDGVSLLSPEGQPVTFVGLQIAHAIAAVLCAVLAGALVWQLVGPAAAPVAQSALLFSPYGLSALYEPAPMLITALCTAAMLLLAVTFRRQRSPAALVAFGAVVGFSASDPPLWLIILLLCLLMAFWVLRSSPIPWFAVGVGALSCAAALLPNVPTPATLAEMAHQYTFGRAQLAAIVMVLYGQQSPLDVANALSIGRPGPFDIPLGALLAPFAIARTPLRLWGDVLLDPATAVLLALGLVLCLRHVTRSRPALLLLGLLLATMAQGSTAQGDAVSHTRIAPALIPMVILAGIGFEALRLTFAASWPARAATALTVAAVAISGLVIFEWVTPTIEPSSWLAIGLEALGTDAPNADAVFLEHGDPQDFKRGAADARRLPNNLRWLFVDHIARLLPARPLSTRTVRELAGGAADAGRVFLWSPALEQDAAVTQTICARWPDAALYTLWDRPGIMRALAAAPRGDAWRPRLPAGRWSVEPCPPPATS